MSSFRKYINVLSIAKSNRKVFFLSFISKLLYLPLTILITYFIWFCIYSYAKVDKINGVDLLDMTRYFFTARIVMYMTSFYKNQSYRIWEDINSGKLSVFLSRPISYTKYQLMYTFGYVIYNFVIMLPVLFIGIVVLQINILKCMDILLFILSIINSMFITFCIYSIIGLITFWNDAVFSLKSLIDKIGLILTGSIIPLNFLPSSIYFITKITPFSSMVYIPIRLLSSHLNVNYSCTLLGIQIFWCIFLWICFNIIWKIGVKKYQAQGG